MVAVGTVRLPLLPSVCCNVDQFCAWKKSRSWLIVWYWEHHVFNEQQCPESWLAQ